MSAQFLSVSNVACVYIYLCMFVLESTCTHVCWCVPMSEVNLRGCDSEAIHPFEKGSFAGTRGLQTRMGLQASKT